MFQLFLRARARRRLQAGLRAARRDHRGLHKGSWTLPAEAVPGHVIAWTREVLATCRRPHGIALFDLTVALDDGGYPEVLRWRRLEPEDLWNDQSPLNRLRTLIADSSTNLRVSASLFSWGDATHYALTR